MEDRKILYGSIALTEIQNEKSKFRTYFKNLNSEKQCLLDNLWNLQTTNNSQKLKILNALAFFLSKNEEESSSSKNFKAFVVTKGFQPGIYAHWEQAFLQIKGFKNPVFQKFEDPLEALKFARKEIPFNLFIDYEIQKKFKTNSTELEFCKHCKSLQYTVLHLNEKIKTLEDEIEKNNTEKLLQKILKNKTEKHDSQPRIILKTRQILSNLPTEVQQLIYQKAHDSFVQEFIDIQEALETIRYPRETRLYSHFFAKPGKCSSQCPYTIQNQHFPFSEESCTCQLLFCIWQLEIDLSTFPEIFINSQGKPIQLTIQKLLDYGLIRKIHIKNSDNIQNFGIKLRKTIDRSLRASQKTEIVVEIRSLLPQWINNRLELSFHKIFIPKTEISLSTEIRIPLRFECALAMEEQIRNQRIHMTAYDFYHTDFRNKQLNLITENQIQKVYSEYYVQDFNPEITIEEEDYKKFKDQVLKFEEIKNEIEFEDLEKQYLEDQLNERMEADYTEPETD